MMRVSRVQRLALIALAAAAIAAIGRVEHGDEERVSRAEPATKREQAAEARPSAVLDTGAAFKSTPLVEPPDVFQPKSWQPPPAPPPAAQPAKPVVPRLPFAYRGQLERDGEIVVFLRRGDETVIAREHQLFETEYRLEAIEPRSLIITYLPLNERQVLSIEAAE